ncbi:MAG: hypothetical protein Q9196_001300 [Gyalolechia fulgens]
MQKTREEDEGSSLLMAKDLSSVLEKPYQHRRVPAGHESSRDETGSTAMVQQPEIALSPPSDSERELGLRVHEGFPFQPSLQVDISKKDLARGLGPPGTHARSASPLQDVELRQRIIYTLHLTFRRRGSPSLTISKVPPRTAYEGIGEYAQEMITRHVQDTWAHELVNKELHFRTGTACVDPFGAKEIHDLSPEGDWDPQLINEPNNTGPIPIDIYRDYIALRNCADTGKTFASTKRGEINSLKCKAGSRNISFFPRIDMRLIASLDTIEKVVGEDPPSAVNSAEREAFVNAIYRSARILFALFVHAQLRMQCLKTLLDYGWNDANFRVKALEEKNQCHEACEWNFGNLLAWQKGFRAAEFFKIGQHQDLDLEQVVPFEYCPYTAEERSIFQENPTSGNHMLQVQAHSSDKEKARCGLGSFSEVFRIRMDPSHHKLTIDTDAPFAVKEFKDGPNRRKRDFERELKVLERLQRYAHAHIVTHLATWVQDNRYYMLFLYATCNLRHYMAKWQFSLLRRKQTLWLLGQLRGLADALRSIHNLSEGPDMQSQSYLTVPIEVTGWHHDLKPDNILFFSTQQSPPIDREAGEGTFQIADFGSAKINTLRSRSIHTRSPHVMPTYEPPEQEREGSTSRPYDVWSMGCVFLELLVWGCFDYDAVKKFSNQRRADCKESDPMKWDAFWQMAEEGHAVQRPAVTGRIATLKAEISRKKHLPFDRVLRVVEDMLTIDSRKRVDAVQVWNRVDRIYQLADAEFQDNDQDDSE